MKKEAKKISALFLSVMIIMMTVAVAMLYSPTVQAVPQVYEGQGCCIETNTNYNDDLNNNELPKYCVTMSDTDAIGNNKCAEGKFIKGASCGDFSRVPECKIGTCLPAKGPCQANVPQAKCLSDDAPKAEAGKDITEIIDENGILLSEDYGLLRVPGIWKAADLKDVVINNMNVCEVGCCSVAGKPCQVVTLKECIEFVDPGFFRGRPSGAKYKVEGYEFTPGLTSGECGNICAKEDWGTCVKGGGECYTLRRSDCKVLEGDQFFQNKLPSELKICSVEPNVKVSCGGVGNDINGRSGDEDKIVWVDSQNNQEEMIYDCSWANAICEICNTEECKMGFDKIGSDEKKLFDEFKKLPSPNLKFDEAKGVVKTGMPYCKPTKCEFTIGPTQRYNNDAKTKIQEANTDNYNNINLLTGTSRCYNLFWDFNTVTNKNKGWNYIVWGLAGGVGGYLIGAGLSALFSVKYSNGGKITSTFLGAILTSAIAGAAKPADVEYREDNPDWFSESTYGKTTGLQSEILHCNYGDVIVEGLGTDRNYICEDHKDGEDKFTYNTVSIKNNWENCRDCGYGRAGTVGNVVNYFGDAFLITWPAGGIYDYILQGFPKNPYCTKEECYTLGDCEFNIDFPSILGEGEKENIKAKKDITGQPNIGSCDPVYTPGTQANSETLSQEEIDAILENKTANIKNEARKERVMERELKALREAQKDEYSKQCGKGGDNTWNLCDVEECNALGDNDFVPASFLSKVGIGTVAGVGAAYAERVSLIPIECLTIPIINKVVTIGESETYSTVGKCFEVRGNQYIPLFWIINTVNNAEVDWKNVLTQVGNVAGGAGIGVAGTGTASGLISLLGLITTLAIPKSQ